MEKEIMGAYRPTSMNGRSAESVWILMDGVKLALPVIEVMDDAMVAVLRAKTGAERLAMAFGLWEMAREILLCAERRRHPDLDEDQLHRLVSERLLRAPY